MELLSLETPAKTFSITDETYLEQKAFVFCLSKKLYFFGPLLHV